MDYQIHFVGVEEQDLLSYESGRDPRKELGLSKLVQMIAKLILTNTDEDLYDPEIGCSMRRLANEEPRYLQSDEGITELAIICMNRAIKIIRENQAGIADPDNRLNTMTLRQAYIDWENYRGVIEYNVFAESGLAARLSLPI